MKEQASDAKFQSTRPVKAATPRRIPSRVRSAGFNPRGP